MAVPLFVDPRFQPTEDIQDFRRLQAGTPDIFNIALNTQRRSVVFRVGTTNIGRGRQQVAGYNIHFITASLVSSSTIFAVDGARSAFAISDIIASTGAPGPGGVAMVESVNQYGKDGYYFAAPISQSGQESPYFAGPIKAPLPGSFVSNATPPDVSDVNLVVTSETYRDRSVRKLKFSATVPSNGRGVALIFVLNPGSGYTYGTDYPVVFTGGNGSGATAVAIINTYGGIEEILMLTGGAYSLLPVVTVPGGTVDPVLSPQLGDATAFAGYQIYMDNYFGNGLTEAQTISGGNAKFPGSTLSDSFYLLPDTPPSGHDIDFYFVSISTTGSRRSDPTGAPVFTLVGGLT